MPASPPSACPPIPATPWPSDPGFARVDLLRRLGLVELALGGAGGRRPALGGRFRASLRGHQRLRARTSAITWRCGSCAGTSRRWPPPATRHPARVLGDAVSLRLARRGRATPPSARASIRFWWRPWCARSRATIRAPSRALGARGPHAAHAGDRAAHGGGARVVLPRRRAPGRAGRQHRARQRASWPG